MHKFQCDTNNKTASYINFALQEFVDRIAITKPINFPLLDVSNKKTKVATSASFHFYDSSLLIDIDKFSKAVFCFGEIITDSQVMDTFFQ